MALPIDLVLVRHGESEGNAAKRRAEKGDATAYSTEFLHRHTSSYRLTAKGRTQPPKTGDWLRQEFYGAGQFGFDRAIVSEYVRAMETAALLDLPDARWYAEFYLTERDWGELDNYSPQERQARFSDNMARRQVEPFFWRPVDGESFADLCLRVDRVLLTLHRECSDKRVVIVCHGEVMWAFRVRIERLSQVKFRELHLSEKSEDRIYNCQVIHYTRRNPETGKLGEHAHWVRVVRPTEDPVWTSGWQHFERPRYSNQDLLDVVEKNPAMVE